VNAVKVDAGGTLNGRLLDAGLVDELSVIVAPHVADGRTDPPVRLLDATAARDLTLLGSQPLRDGHLWLRYAIR
jgi:riboflavin biosynthesis pyrimidine reductase